MTHCTSSRYLILFFILLAGKIALADSADEWLQGMQAFQQNDYTSALQHFESVRDSGQSGPAVHYNIGVCEYELGEYRKARDSFTDLDSDYPKMRSLAQYNLGLVALKLRNKDVARRHFRAAYYLSEDNQTLRILASTMLRDTGPAIAPTHSWIGSFGARAGYDDNIVLRDDFGLPAGTTTDSRIVDAYGSLQGPYTSKNGIRLDAAAYIIRYLDNGDFDQAAFQLGAVYDWRGRGWNVKFGVHASYGTLGGDGFDETGSASIRLIRKLSPSTSLAFRYQYDDVNAADTVFSGIEGSRQKIDARFSWFVDEKQLVLAYRVELNDRRDPSVSPDRNRIIIDYRFSPVSGWGFEIVGEYRNSEFDDLVLKRTEELTTLRVGITRTLSSGWQMLAQYQFSDNDSTDAVFSYQRNQITLGILRLF